jgi:biopolymer transport protein ExbD
MKYILEVCLVALALTTTSPVAAQSPAVPAPPSSAASWDGSLNVAAQPPQTTQQGIGVQLPAAGSAAPMPDADQEGSLIVTVTGDGTVYFGVDPVNPAALAEKIRESLSNRPENPLYIKADARTPYANVLKVLEALRSASVNATILLTGHQVSSHEGTAVPPYGLAVRVGPPQLFGSGTTTVQLLNSVQRPPTLKINGEDTSWAALQSRLSQPAQNRSERVVLVDADGTLPFSDVVSVIDVCRSTGTQVVLVTPEL